MTQYVGESKKCKISYEGMEIEMGYTLMYSLIHSIDCKVVEQEVREMKDIERSNIDIIKRLEGYNPPDRTLDNFKIISIDIQDALAELIKIKEELEEIKTLIGRERDEFGKKELEYLKEIRELKEKIGNK